MEYRYIIEYSMFGSWIGLNTCRSVNTVPLASKFESRVLRRIFGPERDEVTRKWSKLRN